MNGGSGKGENEKLRIVLIFNFVVQYLSHVQLFATHELQHARLHVLYYLTEFAQTHIH